MRKFGKATAVSAVPLLTTLLQRHLVVWPNKNETFVTKLKTIAYCCNTKIFLDSERA